MRIYHYFEVESKCYENLYNKINESWIIDRVIDEWSSNNNDIITNSIQDADIVWIISTWTWKKIRTKHLKDKKVVASIYHIDFDNFNKKMKKIFIRWTNMLICIT